MHAAPPWRPEALPDQLPLVLGERREHVLNEVGHGEPGPIERLPRKREFNAGLLEELRKTGPVLELPGEPIELPHDHAIDLPVDAGSK